MIGRMLLTLMALVAFSGCSSKPQLLSEPVSVKGKVTLNDGSPLKGASITLQPMEAGHPMTFKVSKEGEFEGNLVPGKYMFFIPDSPESNAMKNLDPKVRTPAVERFVQVQPNGVLEIKF